MLESQIKMGSVKCWEFLTTRGCCRCCSLLLLLLSSPIGLLCLDDKGAEPSERVADEPEL